MLNLTSVCLDSINFLLFVKFFDFLNYAFSMLPFLQISGSLSPNFHHAVPWTELPRPDPGEHQLPGADRLLQHAAHSQTGKGYRICIRLVRKFLGFEIIFLSKYYS